MPPKSKYTDVFDIGRFNFMWRMFVIMAAIFAGLTLLHILEKDYPNMAITASAMVVILVSLLITKQTGKYIFGAILGGIAGTLLNQADLFLVIGSQKAVTLLWIVCIVLYIFYLLGPKWGVLALVINLTGVGISIVTVPKKSIVHYILNQDNIDLVSVLINLAVITILLAYLMNQILKASRIAEKQSKEAQLKLMEQYDVVQHQNEEKTVMLKEIHHRVKNNLQVITSLLRLQSREIKDPKVLEHFDEAVQRVLAMALIHEKMYQSKELTKIDLEGYLKTLAQALIDSYNIEKPITLEISCEMQYIQPKSLVSFALMFNELISNSLKHAFTEKNTGLIKIDISLSDNQRVTCTYHDSGIWKAPQREGSFGVQLISDLCEQLDGSFEISKENGTTYKFIFNYLNVE